MVERKGNVPIRPYGQLADPRPLKVTGIPQLKGADNGHFDGRYRVWTVQHGLNWTQHSTGPEAWALVTVDGWHANPNRNVWNDERGGWDLLPDGRVRLAVFRRQPDRSERHPELDGTEYASWEQAYDAVWRAGLMGLMIYDRHAYQQGGLLDAAIAYENEEQAAGRLALTDRQTGDGTWDYWVYDWSQLLAARAQAGQS